MAILNIASHNLEQNIMIVKTNKIFLILLFISICCFFIQTSIDSDYKNIVSSAIALCTFSISSIYTIFYQNVLKTPLSSLSILGLGVSGGAAPLFAQCLDLKPIVFNLDYPIETFLLSLGGVTSAILAHLVYRYVPIFTIFKNLIGEKFYRPIGLMRVPLNIELITIGLIGALAAIYTSGFQDENTIQTGDTIGKFFQAMRPFILFLVVVLVQNLWKLKSSLSIITTLVCVFTILSVAVFANARSVFSSAILTFALAGFILYISGKWAIRNNNAGYVVLILVSVSAIAPLLSRLSTAMLVVRSERSVLSQEELFSRTLDAFFDPSLQSRESIGSSGGYSEQYNSSAFLSRLINTKFTDNVYSEYKLMSQINIDIIKNKSFDKILSAMPQPILNFFSIYLDKDSLAFSSGDMYAYYSGRYRSLGSRLSGSSLADSWVLFGPLCFPVLFAFCLIMFVIKDALTYNWEISSGNATMPVTAIALLSTMFSSGLFSDSFSGLTTEILRGFLQFIIISATLLSITRIMFVARSSTL